MSARDVTRTEAADLLWTTAANGPGGLIFTPTGGQFVLQDALAVVQTAPHLVLGEHPACNPLLVALDPAFGAVQFVLALEPRTDPWTR